MYFERSLLAQLHAVRHAITPYVIYADADVLLHAKLDAKFDNFVSQYDVVVIERSCSAGKLPEKNVQACMRKNKGRDHLLETGFILYKVRGKMQLFVLSLLNVHFFPAGWKRYASIFGTVDSLVSITRGIQL